MEIQSMYSIYEFDSPSKELDDRIKHALFMDRTIQGIEIKLNLILSFEINYIAQTNLTNTLFSAFDLVQNKDLRLLTLLFTSNSLSSFAKSSVIE